ncbi:transcriptional regulator, GntR family [Proteiniborus ethanoligenes]|uniref:Transcriptional regulator, GntR family n=1 Tax=Proteiniborus ethanoligenes TaxID=415015 RepID=A0A1H3KZT3_9FIRM|nr:GntR family transcriptional regulator [Proteiniborus ethanoligenes]SDY57673.1 transcriptional regulator, GntR family [Proteiniborus ethanoligenes]
MSIRLEPVRSNDLRPIREIVYEELRKAIFDGRIKKGEHLVESIIGEKMEVSRTPVREALRQLEAEGLVSNVPRRGAIVQGITKEDAVEIYDLREVLEGLVVRLSCKNITDEDIIKLKDILKKMEETISKKDDESYLNIHGDFNNIIFNRANSKRLQSMMTNIYDYLASLRSISLQKEDRRISALEEHRQIVYALEKRDEEAVEKLAREHVRKAKEAFLKNLI